MTTLINGFQSRFTRLLLGLLLTLVANLASAEVLYVHTDHLGTPRLMTNEQGTTVWRNLPTGEPFGNSPVEEDPDGDSTNTTLNLRFPGQYYDRETNTHYNYFRDHYFPELGRYGQSDPIGLRGGINTYLYVGGNPLSYVDPLGLDRWGDDPSLKAPPSICKYYDDQCKRNCGDSYACAARQCCEAFGDNSSSNCTRKCLIDEDVAECVALSGEEQDKCRFRKHVKCYAQCRNLNDLSKKPWALPQCQPAMNAMGGAIGGYLK